MKKILISTLLLLILISAAINPAANSTAVHALNDDTIYAYLPASAALYAKTDVKIIDSETEGGTDTTDGFTVLTMLPATYFVALIGDIATASENDYYFVNYQDLSGYIKKTSVEICDYEPVTKYAMGTLTTEFDGQNVNLRTVPDHTDTTNILIAIPSATSLSYYGTAQGTALYAALGETWYYVRYETVVDSKAEIFYGYIYNAQANAQKIDANIIERVERNTAEDNPTVTPTPPSFSNLTNTVFIICLCIPAVLIVLMIFKKPAQKRRTPRHYRNDPDIDK